MSEEPIRTTHVWTEDNGMQLLVEQYADRVELVAVAVSDEPDTRYRIALTSRRAELGSAILPDDDKRALEIGRHLLIAFEHLR